jgi:hypothetical protein
MRATSRASLGTYDKCEAGDFVDESMPLEALAATPLLADGIFDGGRLRRKLDQSRAEMRYQSEVEKRPHLVFCFMGSSPSCLNSSFLCHHIHDKGVRRLA